jgi:formylglycine-generating enzyme required for sulfatase activity
MRLVLIPAGEFFMGSRNDEAERSLTIMKQKHVDQWYQQSPTSEVPQHQVRISKSFYMGAYEVTLGQFRKFALKTGYKTDAERDGQGADGKVNGKWSIKPEFNWQNMGFERSDDMPAVNITWSDAVAFCGWLSQSERAEYRLPTEAEWEYACRAGTTTRYFWGESDFWMNEFVWHAGNSGGDSHPVGKLRPNGFGLYDICGNAYEYCSDWFGTNAYTSKFAIDPKGPPTGTERVVRSGSWGTDPMHCRSAFRGGGGGAAHRNMRDGFRVVRSLP